MTFECYSMLEKYMLSCVKKDDPAHDEQHIYRVLYAALEIAQAEQGVDYNILIAACLLHDIGRPEQFRDPRVNHAAVGGDKAYAFLTEHGFSDASTPTATERVPRPKARRRKSSLTQTSWTWQGRWELPER